MSEGSREGTKKAFDYERWDAPFDALDTLFPEGCWLTSLLPPNRATHANSSAGVAELVRQVGAAWPNINTGQYSARIDIVAPDQPLVPVDLRPNFANEPWAQQIKQVLAAGIPWPTDAANEYLLPNGGTDGSLAVVMPGYVNGGLKGAIWELWGAFPPDDTGRGKALLGGRMLGTKQRLVGHGIDRGSSSDPAQWTATGTGEQRGMMTTAAKVPLSHCVMRKAELARGIIRHPLGFGYMTGTASPPVWPAMGWDSASRVVLPQGARFALPHSWVIDPAKPRIQRILEATARDRGFVAVDTSSNVSLRAEPGCEAYFNGLRPDQIMHAFPWGKLVRLADGADTCPTPTN
jgi:hypothetical protein